MGAGTPEELESLFEDALLLRDGEAVAALFASGAALIVADHWPARDPEAIARAALAAWGGERTYLAHPRRVVVARDIALIVAAQGVNVARRGGDGVWRYAIVLQEVGDADRERAIAAGAASGAARST